MKLKFLSLSMRSFATLVLGIFFVLVALDLLLGRIYGQRLGDAWLETKTSKAELLLRRSKAPDFILLGDSRTQNHFDTQTMSEGSQSFFNFGIVGSKFEDILYPALVAKDVAKQGAILNFFLFDLESPVVCSKRPMAAEIELLERAVGESCSYSTIDEFFQKSLIRNQKFFRKPLQYSLDPEKYHNYLKAYDVALQDYDRSINYVRGDRRRLVVTFANGDGEVVGRPAAASTDDKPALKLEIERVNPDKMAILIELAKAYQEAGKRLIINFEPMRFNSVCEIPPLPPLAGLAEIMVTCDKPYLYENWADIAHFNGKGVAHYNADLMVKLKQLVED